tara:strand:+ start:370 stop:1215 length:846 start_codon:yes stop_codon:yes gene_type:complete
MIKYFLQSIFVYFFFTIGRVIGLNLSRKLFSILFSFIAPIFKSKKIIKKNLKIFNKNISKLEEDTIISNVWKNYGKTFIEYIFLDIFRKESSHIKIYGKENLERIKRIKKPVIFISGHFSNFELMSMEITKNEIKLATIYRPLNNYFLNPFMEYLRKKYICKHQIKKGIKGVREAIEFIKKNYSIALMIDQRVSEGERIDFFNQPALTTTLPAQLAIKFNLSIIPVFIERDKNNFIIKFHDEIRPSDFKDKIDLTKKLNNEIEKMILKNPNEWIWSHNRWK